MNFGHEKAEQADAPNLIDVITLTIF